MALTTFTAGTGIQSAPMNANFTEVQKILFKEGGVATTSFTTSTSYVTLATTDLTATGLDFKTYGFRYDVAMQVSNATGNGQIEVVFSDDTTDTITLPEMSDGSNEYQQFFGAYNNTTGKQIKTLNWKAKCSSASGSGIQYESNLITIVSGFAIDFKTSAQFIGYNGY